MSIRKLPGHVIVRRLKMAGVRQRIIAARAEVGQDVVSRVISRKLKGTEKAERVWREIERALSPEEAA